MIQKLDVASYHIPAPGSRLWRARGAGSGRGIHYSQEKVP